MTVRKSFRIVLWAMLALAACFVALVISAVRHNRWEQQANESEKTAGLSAGPPRLQRGLIGRIAGLIAPAPKGVAGALVQPQSVLMQVQPADGVPFNTEALRHWE